MPFSKTPPKAAKSAAGPAKSTPPKPAAKSKTSTVSAKSTADFKAPKASKSAVKVVTLQEAEAVEQKAASKTHHVTREEIAKRAHELWAKRGHHHGSPEQDWLHAEQQLKAELQLKSSAAAN